MISRYTRKEMGKVWSEENKFRLWLEIELLACEAQAQLGVIPKDAVQKIRERAKFDVRRIEEIEKETKHDVIAFLTNVAESVGPESRFVHLGKKKLKEFAPEVKWEDWGKELLHRRQVKDLASILA